MTPTKISTLCAALTMAVLGISAAPEFQAAESETERVAVTDRIDQFIEAGYAANDVKPHPEISDETFVRRIYLDLAGRIPTRDESKVFLADQSANKRNRLINELLESEAYVHHFFNYWSDLLRAKTRIAGNGNSTPAGMAYLEWIKDALRDNMPYDEMARALIGADGQSWNNGAVGYYLRDYGMPLDNLALTSQVFLGTQIVCAQCHNHPFDEWTQMDYYKMAAFTYGVLTTNDSENAREATLLFSQQERGKGAGKGAGKSNGNGKGNNKKPAATDADDSGASMSMSMMAGDGDYDTREMRKAISEILFPVRFNSVRQTDRMPRLPHDYQYDDAKPKAVIWPETPFGPKLAIDRKDEGALDAHPSVAFAEWMTSPENPRFTKVIVNRLWKKVMGYGLIEPADELRAESVASNPELLAFLEQRFIAFDYDMKKFLRTLYSTRTYQREAHTEDVTPGLTYHFPGPLLRRMSAEQIWDSVVAMIVEEPDARSLGAELSRDRTLIKTEWIARAIYDLKPQELLDGALEIAAVQRRLSEEIQQTQVALAAAREDGDAEKINAAQAAVAEIRRQLQEHVAERIYRRGLKQKIELVSSGAGAIGSAENEGEAEFLTDLAALLERDPNFLAESGKPGKIGADDDAESRLKGAGYGGTLMEDVADRIMAPREEERRQINNEIRERELVAWNVDDKKERRSYDSFVRARNRLVRASELPSPAPNGHFLREFGQSDREVIDNANDQASIPQALELLNGEVITALGSRYSLLRRTLQDADSPDEMVRMIYQAMLSRDPSAEESAILTEALSKKETTPVGIVWALLNTRQFLFIQ